jgi:serine phosphatase RsbU (regulator of sigma subunit)
VALHLQPGRGRVCSLVDDDARGCPLGILKERYQPCTPVALEPGDLLVLGSDGVVETRRGGESYGVERLTDFILQRKDQPLPQLLDEVMEAATAFHERARPDDDLTLMLVRRQ